MRVLYERCVHENLRCEHGKPHIGWSSYERCMRVVCTNIYAANTESPTLGGHYTSVAYTRIYAANTEGSIFIRVSRVHKIVLWTHKAITRGATWRPGNIPEKTGLEKERSVIYPRFTLIML